MIGPYLNTHASNKEEWIDTLINMVVQRTGLSEDKARAAVDTVVGFLKERAPAGLSGQIDSLVSGGGEGGIASRVGGMFGTKKEE
ncbi:MAG: hypothetical protein ACREJV_10095 [Candidatus Rokuibacteriota bacterium]